MRTIQRIPTRFAVKTPLWLLLVLAPACETKQSTPPTARPAQQTPPAVEAPPTAIESSTVAAAPAPTTEAPATASEHLALRERLDRTVWKEEVEAQHHEEPFIRLWDDLRLRADKFAVLKAFGFSRVQFQEPSSPRRLDSGVRFFPLEGKPVSLERAEWDAWLDEIEAQGYRIVQTEWHHAGFSPKSDAGPATSLVNFVIDVRREEPARRASIRGELHVRWADTTGDGATPLAESIEARDVSLLVRDAPPAFEVVHTVATGAERDRLMPLIVYDLDRNGFCEIVLGGLNRVYWNRGQGQFDAEAITPGLDIFDTGVIADFTGDGQADFVCVGKDRRPAICAGKPDGRFHPPRRCADVLVNFPKSMTAGDIDNDGDLDLWIGQYKFLYTDGAMPTPFYDANDGYPAFLLVNDGTGTFSDITESAGLAAKRRRRTYSSSLVDLDDDGDLDLMTVNDFSGVDVYRNDGDRRFTDVTDAWLSDRHLFGMAHTLSDFNLDGRLDMYLIGMSSTTARRLDRLQLGREDHPDINRMRKVMGYGNRLLLRADRDAAPYYEQSPFNDRVARTGWSWGTTSFDFDRDGDRDIYIANGHQSGESARDYCTRYWCHDVYTGTSKANEGLLELFRHTLRDLKLGEISWNGFEHNVLLMNLGGADFVNVGFLMGIGFEFDARGVVSEDLDADGRPDLLVVQSRAGGSEPAEYTLHVTRNRMPGDDHWIGVRLYESAEGPSPIGAQVIVHTDRGPQIHRVVTGDSFSSQHSTFAHFGLGAEMRVESVEVRWLDGTRTVVPAPEIDRYHTIGWRQTTSK